MCNWVNFLGTHWPSTHFNLQRKSTRTLLCNSIDQQCLFFFPEKKKQWRLSFSSISNSTQRYSRSEQMIRFAFVFSFGDKHRRTWVAFLLPHLAPMQDARWNKEFLLGELLCSRSFVMSYHDEVVSFTSTYLCPFVLNDVAGNLVRWLFHSNEIEHSVGVDYAVDNRSHHETNDSSTRR